NPGSVFTVGLGHHRPPQLAYLNYSSFRRSVQPMVPTVVFIGFIAVAYCKFIGIGWLGSTEGSPQCAGGSFRSTPALQLWSWEIYEYCATCRGFKKHQSLRPRCRSAVA